MDLEEIKSIFSNVNSWITYADVKIGLLLTIDFTFIIALLDRYSSISAEMSLPYAYSIFLLIIASIILLFAGFPIIYNIFIKKLGHQYSKKTDYNLIFYKDIAQLTQEDFIDKIQERYKFEVNSLAKDYLMEIHTNAKIATFKFLMSRISLIITILCMFMVLILFLAVHFL